MAGRISTGESSGLPNTAQEASILLAEGSVVLTDLLQVAEGLLAHLRLDLRQCDAYSLSTCRATAGLPLSTPSMAATWTPPILQQQPASSTARPWHMWFPLPKAPTALRGRHEDPQGRSRGFGYTTDLSQVPGTDTKEQG